MKKILFVTLAAAVLYCLTPSCSKNHDVTPDEESDSRVDDLMNRVATLEEQAAGMETSISQLQAAQKQLEGYAAKLEADLNAAKSDITANTAKIATLETELANVKESIKKIEESIQTLEDGLAKLSNGLNDSIADVRAWANKTFASVDITNQLATRLNAAEKRIQSNADSLKTFTDTVYLHIRKEISDSLASAETRIQSWVLDTLTKGYWTIAQTQWKIDSVARAVEVKDSTALSNSLKKASEDLTTAYKAAIKHSIDSLAGAVNDTIYNRIKRANDILDAKITAIDTRLSALETTVEKLVARIQKIDVIPNHVSGGVWIKTITENEFNFLISPDSLASKLLAGFNANKTSFILLATRSLTKAATFDTIQFAATVTESGGVLTFKVDGKQSNNKFCMNFYTACLQIKDSVNCSTSGFFPLARPVYPEAPDSACITIGTTTWASVNCGYDATNYKYGKLYQWGRKNGCGYKATDITAKYNDTGSLLQTTASGPVSASSEDAAKFYTSSSSDWLTPQDGTRWNSGTEASPIKTIYDPCPDGWRVPTYAELNTLIDNAGGGGIGGDGWDINNNGYWFNGTTSPSVNFGLFLPAAGYRDYSDGDACDRGSGGFYWSSSVDGGDAWYLYFGSDRAGMVRFGCANGFPVRCVLE